MLNMLTFFTRVCGGGLPKKPRGKFNIFNIFNILRGLGPSGSARVPYAQNMAYGPPHLICHMNRLCIGGARGGL